MLIVSPVATLLKMIIVRTETEIIKMYGENSGLKLLEAEASCTLRLVTSNMAAKQEMDDREIKSEEKIAEFRTHNEEPIIHEMNPIVHNMLTMKLL